MSKLQDIVDSEVDKVLSARKKYKTREYTILEWYIPALMYDDWSGMEKGEERTVKKWMKKEKVLRLVEDGFDDSYFGTDEVTGLKGDVVDVKFVVK